MNLFEHYPQDELAEKADTFEGPGPYQDGDPRNTVTLAPAMMDKYETRIDLITAIVDTLRQVDYAEGTYAITDLQAYLHELCEMVSPDREERAVKMAAHMLDMYAESLRTSVVREYYTQEMADVYKDPADFAQKDAAILWSYVASAVAEAILKGWLPGDPTGSKAEEEELQWDQEGNDG